MIAPTHPFFASFTGFLAGVSSAERLETEIGASSSGLSRVRLYRAMIETRAALAALDDILAVPGIDGVLVGPSDLSIALSGGAAVNPDSAEVDAALTHVVARAKAHGKFAALFTFSGAKAKVMAARGFAMCSISTDQLLLRQAAKAELAAAR